MKCFFFILFLVLGVFLIAKPILSDPVQQIQKMQKTPMNEFLKTQQELAWIQKLNQGRLAQNIQKTSHAQRTQKRRGELMILVSFSMAPRNLHQYLIDASKIGGHLVLRGLVNNSLKVTAQYVSDVVQGTQSGIQIDPIIFEKLAIYQVPAIVLFDSSALPCLDDADCRMNPRDYDTVTGNVSVDYALQIFSQSHSSPASLVSRAQKLLQQFEKQ